MNNDYIGLNIIKQESCGKIKMLKGQISFAINSFHAIIDNLQVLL